MRSRNAKRGETLVETIVAFAVLMIILTMVTTVIRAATALNNRASQNLLALHADCTRLEEDVTNLNAVGSDELTLEYIGPTGREGISILLDVEKGDMLYCFTAKPGIGGGP